MFNSLREKKYFFTIKNVSEKVDIMLDFLKGRNQSKIVKTISFWYIVIFFCLFVIALIAVPAILRLDSIAKDIYIFTPLL